MSLKAKLVEKANDLVDDKVEGWFEKGLDKAGELVLGLPDEEKEAAAKVIQALRTGKDPLARLGTLGFAKLTSYLIEDDDEDHARRFYLEHEATYTERRERMQAITDGLITAEDADKAAWEAAKEVLLQSASLALPFLLKVAAGMVGLPL